MLLAQVARLDHQITAVMHLPGAEQLLDPADSVEKLNGSANKLKTRFDDDHESSV